VRHAAGTTARIGGRSRSQRRLTVGWADPEDGPGDLLGDVLAHQRDDHRHRPDQADPGRAAAWPGDVAGPLEDPCRQFVQLPAA